ncbi:MAG: Hpt domain-containing protein [Desulfobacterales bacterium]|jgi:HPt (histidine-containing phosphotransfer) domain-containing protein|nr:Hpt domain-containing protein [Desulfobacterales bacterium]
MNFEKLAGEIGFDNEDYLELIELFINTTTDDIAKLKTAINNGDFNAAENAAHSIKGAASSLGLMEISDEAKKIEYAAKGGADKLTEISAGELETMLNRIRESYNASKGE